jgi:hypothetical protein
MEKRQTINYTRTKKNDKTLQKLLATYKIEKIIEN